MKHKIGKDSMRLLVSLVLASAAVFGQSALESDPKGWRDLLPDSAFKGWTRVPIPPTAALTPESHWSVDPAQRLIICDGDKTGHEWLRLDRPFADFLLHVEFHFTPVQTEKPRYNSGVFIRNDKEGKIWYQAQIGSANGGYIFGDNSVGGGEPKRFNLAKQMKEQRVKPAGEWNTYELRCEGKKISLWTNGAVTSEFTECENLKGYLGLEAEGYRIEFRNLKVKELR